MFLLGCMGYLNFRPSIVVRITQVVDLGEVVAECIRASKFFFDELPASSADMLSARKCELLGWWILVVYPPSVCEVDGFLFARRSPMISEACWSSEEACNRNLCRLKNNCTERHTVVFGVVCC